MKKLILFVSLSVLSTAPAFALFTNGGFETGNDYGWTIAGDHSVISSFTPQFHNTSGWVSGIPYYGNYSLMLGSGDVGNVWDNYHYSIASQDAVLTQADIEAGIDSFYFGWGSLLEEPTNGVVHPDSQQPYFSIEVTANGSTIYSVEHRANQPGWTQVGHSASGDAGSIWYGSGVAEIDLSGLDADTMFSIDLYVRDCGQGGHGGLVFLDGFGTVRPDDPGHHGVVPEPMTLSLIAMGLGGIMIRRFRV